MKFIGVRYTFPNTIREFTVDEVMAQASYKGDADALAAAHKSLGAELFEATEKFDRTIDRQTGEVRNHPE